jgi:hypothetical protein
MTNELPLFIMQTLLGYGMFVIDYLRNVTDVKSSMFNDIYRVAFQVT